MGVVSALVMAALTQAVPQSQHASNSARSAADSVRIVRNARSAQLSFEGFRRSRLPRREGGSPPVCNATIGRFCHWRDDNGEPPPEAAAVIDRRRQLVAVLDTAVRALPGDRWLLGLRAQYLVEAHDTTGVRGSLADCRAAASWCAALAGYVAHSVGAYAVADSAYELALARMNDDQRCDWLNIADLIDGDLARRYLALDCRGREHMARRLFALGAPLYLVATTDLFTEHLARLTRTRIAEAAATTYGDAWGDDFRVLMLRYGWPTWYSRSEPPIGSQHTASITGHDSGLLYYMLPSLRTYDHPGATTVDDWHLDDPHAPSGYVPAATRTIRALPHQVARFRHGDSTFVIAAWDASSDASISRNSEAALALTDDDSLRALVRRPAEGAGSRTGSAWASIAADSGLVSIEVLDREARRAARARVGFAPPRAGTLRLSDLLLYRPWTADLPRSAGPSLAEHAAPSDAVARRDGIAVYWETYGLPPTSEPVRFALSVEQIGVSWARRAAERFHLADRTSGVRVEWTEVPLLDGDRAGRGVRVDLSRLRPGRYRMELTITGRSDATATSVREIVVR